MFPVLAHAARLASIIRACVNAAHIPLSLKLPEGFIPSYCRCNLPASMPMNDPTASVCCNRVCPSPTVTILSWGANGNNSWNRQTPLKRIGLVRCDHIASNSFIRLGTAKRSHS